MHFGVFNDGHAKIVSAEFANSIVLTRG